MHLSEGNSSSTSTIEKYNDMQEEAGRSNQQADAIPVPQNFGRASNAKYSLPKTTYLKLILVFVVDATAAHQALLPTLTSAAGIGVR